VSVLRPQSIGALARRLFRELAARRSAFDLPARRFVQGNARHDLSVKLGGAVAASPIGPAAGPHTQLAQNIVLSWLAGGRAIELKTVQQLDALTLPRPCIDVRGVGLNCEWSQELRAAESAEEYVKGALLVAVLAESGLAGVLPGFRGTVLDASIGYDLAGIRGEKVDGFLRTMRHAGPLAARLRAELPREARPWADAPLPDRLIEGVTLSTFHGCPPGEIEAIVGHVFEAHGLSCVVKLNPTLLGKQAVSALLHDALGYSDVRVPDAAFERDPGFDQAVAMIGRLSGRARSLGLSFGVKLTNTLVVENTSATLPREAREAYLSGPPLHVLAIQLVARLREALGPELPLSFSAGIDAQNAADAVALGLAPVTLCTDWLKTGGYGRGIKLYEALYERMDHAGAPTRAAWILRARGQAEQALSDAGVPAPLREGALAALSRGEDPRPHLGEALFEAWVRAAAARNTRVYAEEVLRDPRYRKDHLERPPKKVGTCLSLFDCLTCDKCVAVCPNDALFTFVGAHVALPIEVARKDASGWTFARTGTLSTDERHQIAVLADACNDCGNCDTHCPEDGGPQLAKPRLFGSEEALLADPIGGFFVRRRPGGYEALVRLSGVTARLVTRGDAAAFSGEGFEVRFSWRDPTGTLEGEARSAVDLGLARTAHLVATGVLGGREVNPVACLEEEGT
jgi:putative selenate reductase